MPSRSYLRPRARRYRTTNAVTHLAERSRAAADEVLDIIHNVKPSTLESESFRLRVARAIGRHMRTVLTNEETKHT